MCEPSECSCAVQPTVPIFEVALKNVVVNARRSITTDLRNIQEQRRCRLNVDWGYSRVGSWKLDGQATSVNRYVIDFKTWEQRNLDNDRRRSVRLVWVAAERVDPKWIGQIPTEFGQC